MWGLSTYHSKFQTFWMHLHVGVKIMFHTTGHPYFFEVYYKSRPAYCQANQLWERHSHCHCLTSTPSPPKRGEDMRRECCERNGVAVPRRMGMFINALRLSPTAAAVRQVENYTRPESRKKNGSRKYIKQPDALAWQLISTSCCNCSLCASYFHLSQ